MLEHHVIRILLGGIGFFAWLVVYFIARFGRRSLKHFAPWSRALFVVMFGASMLCFVLDWSRLSDILGMNAWGMLGIWSWLQRRFRSGEPSRPGLITLGLSQGDTDSSKP